MTGLRGSQIRNLWRWAAWEMLKKGDWRSFFEAARYSFLDFPPKTWKTGVRLYEVTQSGKVLTEKDFERLADEAEKGYAVDELLARREQKEDS